MSFSQMRPRTSQLVELHVFYVPAEVWNFKLNTVPVALTSKFISAGFIRVSPHITIRVLREKLGEYLGGVIVADKFKFLKCIGKKLVVVKAKQETELELKSFAPPYALYPELYLLPGVGYFEDVYPLPSSTQQKHHFIEEANRFGLGSRFSSLSQQKPEKSKPFLESVQSRCQVESLEVPSPVEWGEKEPVPVSHTNNKQDNNNRIQENQFGEKDQSGSDGPFFTPSHSNPADQESGKCDLVLQSSEQNHLSQDQEDCDAPKWNDKSKGTALTHVNHGDEQGQDNQRLQNHIKYQKELTNIENSEHQKETKLRRNRTQDAEIFEIMEDQTTDYVHKKQRLQQNRTKKTRADLGEELDNQADENKQNHLTCPKEYISPPSPPFLALTVNPVQVPVIQAAKNKMAEQLQQMKKDRRHMEKSREELIKKAKGLLEQNKLRRYHVREEWKKKYFETKKATVSLEDTLNKLRQDLELYHQKLLLQLEARASRQRPNNTTNSKNYTIIQIATVQHEHDQLRKKLDDTKMKLIIEIKMRKQAASDLRALRAELTQKKIHSALILQSRKSGI
ncbi:spermatogenesis-associated protein 1 isoform X1 [Corvus moneduloides]|uniref:spermatogenesis-associated protein 1 isoform X1 n=1 Tax=Corvus moneduloides TaxID=1196302 RepID=UPI0013626A85|nr:spermatogenesis-associated protein 1 isoform X1 [Corvus moneduloides]XP_031973964.1 spermatogenesis-associated protein 1 isoform X1 [Corvus moneduloides]